MAFKHLNSEERHYIEIELKNGTSQNKIAKKLGRSQSSLSRELGRNKGLRGYRHQQAHRMAKQRHQEKKQGC